MGKKLYVGNLPYDTAETQLQDLFAQAGTVESVKVMRDMATGRARGFAFVEMSSDDEAQSAITTLNGQDLGGRALTVKARPPRSWPFSLLMAVCASSSLDISTNAKPRARPVAISRITLTVSTVPAPAKSVWRACSSVS